MFSCLSETVFIIKATLNLSSVNAFNLVKAKILSFGKRVKKDKMLTITVYFKSLPNNLFFGTGPNSKHLHMTNLSKIIFCFYSGRKHCGKSRKCYLSFANNVFKRFPSQGNQKLGLYDTELKSLV